MDILFQWLVSALAILVSSYVLPGIQVESFFVALVLVVVLGLINAVLKPVIVLLTLPVNIVTLGLFTLVINGVLVLLASSIVPGFHVAGFWWAVLFSLVLTLVNGFFRKFSRSNGHYAHVVRKPATFKIEE